jgi:hypothetical protein
MMNRTASIAIAACAAALLCTPAAAADVGVSVNVGQPGFYGRIDIGRFPPPPVIYAQPIVIAPVRVAVEQRPIYLRVPPGHAKNWAKHCSHYNACGQRTYFVEEDWYRTVYAPAAGHRYQEAQNRHAPQRDYREDRGDRGNSRGHGGDEGHGKGHGKSKGKGKD